MRDDFSIKSDIIDALEKVQDPQRGNDLVSLGMVDNVDVNQGVVKVTVVFADDRPQNERFELEDAVYDAIEEIEGITDATVLPTTKSGVHRPEESATPKKKGLRIHGGGGAPQQSSPPSSAPAAAGGGATQQRGLEEVGQVIAVASGKGGVGKSTVAVNLALALKHLGFRTGLLDIDIYGPSLPTLLGVQERPAVKERRIIPVEAGGLRVMSLGFLMEEDTPVIWRGPIVTGIIRQFLQDVDWRGLDYLIVDLPPGTGDAQLSLAQTVPVDGAVVVTTPSDLALIDAARGLQMFRTLNVEVLGIVENMSYFTWPAQARAQALVETLREQISDNAAASATLNELDNVLTEEARIHIFGEAGGKREAERLDIPLLGEIPLDTTVRAGGDAGKPIVLSDPESPVSQAFVAIADRVAKAKPVEPTQGDGEKKGVFSFLKN